MMIGWTVLWGNGPANPAQVRLAVAQSLGAHLPVQDEAGALHAVPPSSTEQFASSTSGAPSVAASSSGAASELARALSSWLEAHAVGARSARSRPAMAREVMELGRSQPACRHLDARSLDRRATGSVPQCAEHDTRARMEGAPFRSPSHKKVAGTLGWNAP